MAKGERTMKVFQVLDEDGKLTRLVEAYNVAQVKNYILGNIAIMPASALTVARASVKTEKAD